MAPPRRDAFFRKGVEESAQELIQNVAQVLQLDVQTDRETVELVVLRLLLYADPRFARKDLALREDERAAFEALAATNKAVSAMLNTQLLLGHLESQVKHWGLRGPELRRALARKSNTR